MNGKGTSNITAAVSHSLAGPTVFQGYTATPGDGGKWTIDGGTTGVSYVLISLAAGSNNCILEDLVFQNNGASGSADGLSIASNRSILRRCVVNGVRGNGFNAAGSSQTLIECEAYGCNQSNTATLAGFLLGTGGVVALRCNAHDNTGSNTNGFNVQVGQLVNCIADSNGKYGFWANFSGSGTVSLLTGCDSYNNGSDGIAVGNGSNPVSVYGENCNLVKNGGYGINGITTGGRCGDFFSCGFGSGTQANTSGQANGLQSIIVSGSITYAANVTPWVDAPNGDFRINRAAAKNTGRGSFTQTQGGYAGSVGYPDVGSNQHLDAGGGLLINPGLSGGLR